MKIGLFFGAGAEIGYGLPNGGKFAIELFRQDPTPYKEKLRAELKSIDNKSIYANKWLPEGYSNKSIYAFGKNEFSSIIESSIQYKRNAILDNLKNFDLLCEKAVKELNIEEENFSTKLYDSYSFYLGDVLYGQEIKFNRILSGNSDLFESRYYSAILEVLKKGKNVDDLKRYAVAFLQLLVGAHGYNLVKELNEELFEHTPDDLPIFDDIFGMFKLEFNQIASIALDLLLGEKRTFDTNNDSSVENLLSAISQKVLEYLFTEVLDYQKLIDEHFRYLFSPCTEWAKFTKMVIFLEIAQDYIAKQIPENITTDGYYNDLTIIKDSIFQIGTANYNSILSRIIPELDNKVIHLNGSVKDFYNPYKNEVVQYDEKPSDLKQIHVPFLLTQSGLKPLTSVEMSRRYVSLFDYFKESDVIIVVGFGFNQDDSHINGLFRELVEKNNKKLFVVGVSDSNEIKKRAINNLRIDSNSSNIIGVSVDKKDRTIDGKLWISYILNHLSSEESSKDNQ